MNIKEVEIDLPACPDCGHQTRKKIGWLTTHTQFSCRCGSIIGLESKELAEAIRSIEKSLRDLERELSKLGK